MGRRANQQQWSSRVRRRVLWAVGGIVGVVALLVLIRFGYAERWTGFGQYNVNGEVQPFKTLWDWLDLLVVPIVLALGGYLFTRSENRKTQDVAREGRQDDTLQAYLDGMAQLLTDKDRPLHRAQVGDSLSTVARARTLTVIGRLDGDRKRSVLQFLFESGLIHKHHGRLGDSALDLIESRHPVVGLEQADLSGAKLSGINLIGAYLGGVNLSEADLSWAALNASVLGGANLSKADLSRADLAKAVLPGADLRGARLIDAGLVETALGGANLSGADLSGANMTGVNLRGVRPFEDGAFGADLSEADLSGVEGISIRELERQARSLTGATMPNGQKYEDWLKNASNRRDDNAG